MRRRIHVETSIPSFYFEVRAEPDMIARRDWTNQWWTRAHDRDELVTSEAVLNELGRVGHPRQEDCLALVSGLRLLPIDGAIADTPERRVETGGRTGGNTVLARANAVLDVVHFS